MEEKRPLAHEKVTITTKPTPEKSAKKDWYNRLSTVALIFLAPAVALLLTSFVFQSYQVSGHSTEPTLQNEDRLLVWKLPRTLARLTGHAYVPKRGDIVIFTEPRIAYYGLPADEQLIKRVIGLPGERVVVKDGTITVYNHARPKGFHPDDLMDYGKTIPTTIQNTEVTVGATELFVAGDNRLNSEDSRYFGPIKLANIRGKLSLRILPIEKTGKF